MSIVVERDLLLSGFVTELRDDLTNEKWMNQHYVENNETPDELSLIIPMMNKSRRKKVFHGKSFLRAKVLLCFFVRHKFLFHSIFLINNNYH